jgi:RND family efflux transporter MFP subunit
VEQGEYATPGRQLFNVVRIHPVRVTLDIPERDIRSLNIGDTLPFDIISRPNETFEGTVSYISAKAASGNNAFRIELTAPNPEHKLRPGMIASVRHQRGIREKAVTLPLEAVIPQKGDNVVYLVRDGKAMRQVVRIDALLAQEAVILSGVEAGDQVVTRGNRMLTDGTPVTIRNPGKNGG